MLGTGRVPRPGVLLSIQAVDVYIRTDSWLAQQLLFWFSCCISPTHCLLSSRQPSEQHARAMDIVTDRVPVAAPASDMTECAVLMEYIAAGIAPV